MKLRYNIFYTIIVGLLFLSCSHFEEVEPEQLKPVEKVQMTLTAHMDMEEPLTKTYLAGDPVASSRYTYWLPADEIGVLSLSLNKFTNTSADTSAVAVFEGKSELASRYYAIYPYSDQTFQSAGDGKLIFNIPAVQKYQKNTFATDVVPMVTKFKSGDELYFKNACGGLVIKVKGVEKIKSMRLVAYEKTGVEAKIAGQCLVDMNSEEYVITPEISASTSISIDCGSGVQLNESEPVAFHFALAPATYHGFRVVMMSEDGKFMVKETDKELNIKRANITYAAPFSFVESEPVDLSLRGTSNCYVVSEANRYCFNASVIGNGTYGIIPDASFHTSDPSISPVSVKVLWESTGANVKAAVGDIVSDVILKDGYVYFSSTGKEGNALLAVKDADGNILWSWHIWVTDMPADQTYVNSAGTFVVQDRNLGAVRADQGNGDEYKESHGLVYQWGRKDPFCLDNFTYITWKNTSSYSVEDIIRQPEALSVATSSFSPSANWTNQDIIDFWSDDRKTIYDPCPVGYKVSLPSAWSDFTDLSNIQSSYDYGLMVKYNTTESAWYPFTYYHDHWDNRIIKDEGRIQIWSSNQIISNTSRKWTNEKALSYDKNDHKKGLILTDVENTCALSVRCMKDEGFVDLALPTVEKPGVRKTTAESVTLSFSITDEGASEVAEAGIIYSTSPGVCAENGTKLTRTGEENIVEVTGLAEGTKYYAIAYATNSYGTAYSDEIVFYTEFANCTNLSKYGTSNCYIVTKPGAYTFDAVVKGNGQESIYNDDALRLDLTAVVLWETNNTDTSIEVEDIIHSVQYDAGFIRFAATGVPGNALIAVQDSSGTILWSWHIWSCDFDPYATANTYISGAVFMDRNLGALNVEKNDVRSYGLFYQWGRKDPSVGPLGRNGNYFAVTAPADAINYVSATTSNNTLTFTTNNPTTVIDGSTWNNEDYLWASEKTIYDPCPIGWRIPDKSAWEGVSTSDYMINEPYSVPAAYCPVVGITEGYAYVKYSSEWLCIWSTSRREYFASNGNSPSNNIFSSRDVDNQMSVRCMREHAVNAELSTVEVSDITKNSATVRGHIKYVGENDITEMGFVYSSTTDLPNLNSTKITSSVAEGAFTTTLTDLKPGTTYYVRTFAAEGNTVIYGNVLSFTTVMYGDTEEIPGDDYEWE